MELLDRFYLRQGHNQPDRTATLVVVTHVVLLAGWATVALAGAATVPVLVMTGLHTPFLYYFAPLRELGGDDRRRFQVLGGRKETARAIFRTGLPFWCLGVVICGYALLRLLG